MSTRTLLLLAVAAVVIIAAAIFVRSGYRPPEGAGRPSSTDVVFGGDPCTITKKPDRMEVSKSRGTEATWRIQNDCRIDIVVCMDGFRFERPFGDDRDKPLEGTDDHEPGKQDHCASVRPTRRDTIKAKAKGNAEVGTYEYSVMLNGTRVDPMIDIIP